MRGGPIFLVGMDPALPFLIEPVHFSFEPQLAWLLCLACLAGFAGNTQLCVAEHTLFSCRPVAWHSCQRKTERETKR